MSASIIRAAGHRHLFRGKALRLFPAVVLSLYASALAAVEAPGKPVLEKNNFYLSSAGFRIQVANDPAGQKAMRALPAHRFVTEGAGDAMRYYYAEPQRCICVFVGTREAYDRYRHTAGERLFAGLPAAERAVIEALAHAGNRPLAASNGPLASTILEIAKLRIAVDRHPDGVMSYDEWKSARAQQ